MIFLGFNGQNDNLILFITPKYYSMDLINVVFCHCIYDVHGI